MNLIEVKMKAVDAELLTEKFECRFSQTTCRNIGKRFLLGTFLLCFFFNWIFCLIISFFFLDTSLTDWCEMQQN